MTASLARPPALRPGDRVAVLSASSPPNQDRLATGLDALRFAGLEPVVYPSARDEGTLRRYLAGDDAQRASDLTDALQDPRIAGIVFACGGSGAHRTLDAIDWAALTGLAPKVMAGYSDVTAVLEAAAVRLGWASLHSSMVCFFDTYEFASMLRSLMTPDRATELTFGCATTVGKGMARGRTCGGNLTVLAASLGTDTSWPARGGIWLVEDESEDDYRIDRMLTQLRRSGYLDGVAGIVTGSFVNCGEPADIQAILDERLGSLGVPMISGANLGHGGHNQTFPIGVAAELDADARTLRLLEPPLIPVEN
ncbi:MAG TPA: LD-carboxypeptidase [Jatrophihabitantaceae bacterium]|jgi:muramoyltetrapeptide carboxypeptidase